MPNLRDMIDHNTIFAGAPAAKKPSPVAQHVASHIQDPLGSTKQDFTDLTDKRLAYDSARSKAQMNLAPVQSVIDHASLLHGLTIPRGGQPMPGTPGMDTAQPGAQDNPELDENGNPIPPNQNTMPGTAGQTQTGQPNGPGALIGKPMPGNGNSPKNMSQTVGKMNSNRPSLAGQQPGVSPGPAESVRPPKLGMAQPGKPSASNAPNPQGNMYNKQAMPPKGNKSLPGAKGPGDPKVENRTKKAQSKSNREIKVHVTAAADYSDDDIRQMLNEALKAKVGGSGSDLPCTSCDGSYFYITALFSANNYCIFTQKGKQYRQNYKFADGAVTLVGDPTKVKIAYVKAMSASTSAIPRDIQAGAFNRIETQFGIERLHCQAAVPSTGKVSPTLPHKAGPPSMVSTKPVIQSKYVKAGPSSLSDKVSTNQDPQNEVAYNPKISAGGRCKTCGKKMSACTCMKATGHALGAKKGWSTRGKGHLSRVEKDAHYKTMTAV